MRPTALAFTAALLAWAVLAHAAPQPQLSIPDLAQKADFLIVGQVVKIEDAGQTTDDAYKIPLLHKRATIRVLRGMKSSDASPVGFTQIIVDYLAVKDPNAIDAPQFPQLYMDQVAVFPIKAGTDRSWKFVAAEDRGMIAPAVPQELTTGWPANVDGNIAFVYREIASAFAYGDFPTMAAAAAYLDRLGPAKEQPADYVFALIKSEIGDSLLREDTRWVTIACASYIASATPRPSLDALINGMVAAGGGAARAPTDGLPAVASLRLATLNLRKASKFQLAERILMLLIAHQEDPGLAWGIAKTLVDNFDGAPMMISMEQSAIRTGKPGAMYVADFMIKDGGHPLAKSAAEGARITISPDGDARAIPDDAAFSPLLRESEGLLLRAGSEDDFAFLLDEVNQARLHDPKTYEALLILAADSELSPTPRVLALCREYIADHKPMAKPPLATFRLCDLAALTVARLGKQDFGLNPSDPAEKRDEAIAKAAAWLKSQFPSPGTEPATMTVPNSPI